MTRMISYVLNPSKPCVSFCSVESPQWLWSLGIGSRLKSEESQSNASSIRESQSFYYIDVSPSPTHPWMFIHAELHQVICCIHRVVRSKQIEIDVPRRRRRRNRRNLFAHVACTRARSCSMTQPCCAAKVGGVKGSNVQTVLWKTILKKHGFCEFIKKLMLPLCMHKAHSRVHVHRWLEHPLHSGTLGQSLVWLQWSRHCTWLSCLDWKLMETSETRKFSGPKILWGLGVGRAEAYQWGKKTKTRHVRWFSWWVCEICDCAMNELCTMITRGEFQQVGFGNLVGLWFFSQPLSHCIAIRVGALGGARPLSAHAARWGPQWQCCELSWY